MIILTIQNFLTNISTNFQTPNYPLSPSRGEHYDGYDDFWNQPRRVDDYSLYDFRLLECRNPCELARRREPLQSGNYNNQDWKNPIAPEGQDNSVEPKFKNFFEADPSTQLAVMYERSKQHGLNPETNQYLSALYSTGDTSLHSSNKDFFEGAGSTTIPTAAKVKAVFLGNSTLGKRKIDNEFKEEPKILKFNIVMSCKEASVRLKSIESMAVPGKKPFTIIKDKKKPEQNPINKVPGLGKEKKEIFTTSKDKKTSAQNPIKNVPGLSTKEVVKTIHQVGEITNKILECKQRKEQPPDYLIKLYTKILYLQPAFEQISENKLWQSWLIKCLESGCAKTYAGVKDYLSSATDERKALEKLREIGSFKVLENVTKEETRNLNVKDLKASGSLITFKIVIL